MNFLILPSLILTSSLANNLAIAIHENQQNNSVGITAEDNLLVTPQETVELKKATDKSILSDEQNECEVFMAHYEYWRGVNKSWDSSTADEQDFDKTVTNILRYQTGDTMAWREW